MILLSGMGDSLDNRDRDIDGLQRIDKDVRVDPKGSEGPKEM